MSQNAWLTVDDLPAARITRTITVPDDDAWLAILRGCLYLLTVEENYEQFGTLTPAEMADEWRRIFFAFLEDPPVLIPPGLMSPFAGSVAPAGWLLCDGNAISRTTYAALFAAIGVDFGVGDGSTTFNVPDMRGRVPVGQDPSQTEFDVIGESGGAKAVTLATAEMPVHGHTQNSHNHTQNTHGHEQQAHTHTQNSHNHNQTAHAHNRNAAGRGEEVQRATVGGGSFGFTSGTRIIDAYVVTADATAVNQAATAVNQSTDPTIDGTIATNQAATATNQNTGGGAAHQNMPPYLVVGGYIIKT